MVATHKEMEAHRAMRVEKQREDEALEKLEEAKAFAESNKLPTANLLLTEVSLRLSVGDAAGFQNAIEAISTRYGREPEVMARLQQMLMAYGLIGPDGSPRTASPSPAMAQGAPASELWTPDQPAQPAQEGGSKLWIPGMD